MSRLPRAVVINDVSVARGGATALALMEVELLRRRQIAVTYVTGDAGENPLFSRVGSPVVALGEQRLISAGFRSSVSRGLYNPRTFAVLTDWIRRNDTADTVYHLHGWSQILSPSIFRALAPVQARTIITAHDFFLVCPNGAYANFAAKTECALEPLSLSCLVANCDKRDYAHKLWRVARQSVQSRTLRFADARPTVLMINEAMREPLTRGGVPNECLRAAPNPVTSWSNVRIEAEANAGFLFVGRLAEEKGADIAASAARRAGAPLTIIGDGPMLAELSREYPEVTFVGRLPPEAIAQHARSARALIMPSRYPEPYGLVAVEALWSGLPVLTAKSALLARDIHRLEAGLLFDPFNEAELVDALCRVAGDADLAREMSLNAFVRTRELGLSPDEWADALVSVFEEQLMDRTPVVSTH